MAGGWRALKLKMWQMLLDFEILAARVVKIGAKESEHVCVPILI